MVKSMCEQSTGCDLFVFVFGRCGSFAIVHLTLNHSYMLE